jgi:ATP-dependent Clp protease ATP-binding subunit ClpX
VVTPQVVMNPEEELKALEKDYEQPDRIERFEAAARRERESVKKFMAERLGDYQQRSGLEMYAERLDLVSEIYSKVTSDLNTIFDEFTDMVRQVKQEEASLSQDLEMNISFDEGAVDELIRKAVDTGHEAGSVASQLVKRLEYGLKLVKDRSGADLFVITREAVTDMERYINDLVKRYYRECSPEHSN